MRIVELETEPFMIRSHCVDHRCAVMTDAQFAKVLKMAAAM